LHLVQVHIAQYLVHFAKGRGAMCLTYTIV